MDLLYTLSSRGARNFDSRGQSLAGLAWYGAKKQKRQHQILKDARNIRASWPINKLKGQQH